MRTIEQEFCDYLKQGEFTEFMQLWRKQVERLGHIGGTIHMTLNEKNKGALEGLLGTSYHHRETCSISWPSLRKAIDQTKFEGCDFALVLQYYFQETIISRKEHRTRKEEAFQTFLAAIILSYKEEQGELWLSELLQEKGVVYQRIRQQYEQDQSMLKQQLSWVMQALAQLPVWSKKTVNLAIFASQITGDPHAFDYGKFPAYLLLQGIRFLLQPANPCNSHMDKNELLVQAGLYKDSISNYCMLFHLLAFDLLGNIHPGWQGFYDHQEIWNVNCSNLDAIQCMDASSVQVVMIIENPSVFQTLSAFVTTHQLTSFGFVCTNGQLNFCGYRLLDLIHEAGIPMFYCGDMDPEGLLIADRLKLRYQENLTLWHYTEQDYEQAKSSKHASKQRCHMIQQLQDEQLCKIGTSLLNQPVGYQENLLSAYKQSLLNWER